MSKRLNVFWFELLMCILVSSLVRSANVDYATYTNPQLGIEFSYPKSWRNTPLMANNGRDVAEFDGEFDKSRRAPSRITLGLALNLKNSDLVEYISGYCDTFHGKISAVSKGEIRAVLCADTCPNGGHDYYFMRSGTKSPVFVFWLSGEAVSLEDHLLSSIHFIGPDGSPIPKNYPDYGAMFPSRNSPTAIELRKLLGM